VESEAAGPLPPGLWHFVGRDELKAAAETFFAQSEKRSHSGTDAIRP
jgi:hypothetical protein